MALADVKKKDTIPGFREEKKRGDRRSSFSLHPRFDAP